MGIRAVRISVIAIIFTIIFFPGFTSSIAFSAVEIPQRGIEVPTSDNNQTGAIGTNQQDSIKTGSSNQELVEVSNNMSTSKTSELRLEKTYGWEIADPGGANRSLKSGQSTTYNVDTTRLSSSPTEGNYTIRMIEGSFVISINRSVLFEEPNILESERSVITGSIGVSKNNSKEQSFDIKARALGSTSTDITRDGRSYLPYVSNNGAVRVVDSNGNKKTLGGKKPKANKDKTLLSVGKWKESSTSVLFANKKKDSIYRVGFTGSKTKIVSPSNGVQAISGIANIDSDSTKELIFVDSSQQLRYLEESGDTEKIQNAGIGSDNGLGVGQPIDLDNDGISRISAVDGSGNILLAGVSETSLTITSANAAKSPTTSADIDADGKSEILYIGSQNNHIKYIDNPLSGQTIKTVFNDQGEPITGDDSVGIVSK